MIESLQLAPLMHYILYRLSHAGFSMKRVGVPYLSILDAFASSKHVVPFIQM